MSDRTEAHIRRAVAAHLAGRPEEASAICSRVLRDTPLHFGALLLGGSAAFALERLEEAACLLGMAVRVRPGSGWALLCLGRTQAALSRTAEGEANMKAGLAKDSRNPEAWHMLGVHLARLGRKADAMECYRQALKLKPDYADALATIGDLFLGEGQLKEAEASCRLALAADARNPTAHLVLAQALQALNRVPEALCACDHLLAAHPGHMRARSNRLFLLNYLSEIPSAALLAEHKAYGAALPKPRARRFANARDPLRRIRVGFLSPDLRGHSVAYFIEPLLAHLDPAAFEVVLYHDNARVDEVSRRLGARAALWRNLAARPDGVAEAMIRADAPDVMVDLAGHTGQNRLQLFARRLAPVQVAYLGYPNTSGVAAMDYRFTDAIADPEGQADGLCVERLVRFSACAWAYLPSAEAEAAGEAPLIRPSGAPSFGSFNNLCKVNDFTLRLWGEVLQAAPGSTLVLKGLRMDAERVGRRLAAAGIDGRRVTLLQPEPTFASHLASYAKVDVALDPFPYGGTTTTCEALWMGRPVVTLAGDRHASRVGASLLTAVGRPRWVAGRPADYVRIAAGLASDRGALRREGAALRAAMRGSALMDHVGQARRFGDALRACWTGWCDGAGDFAARPEGVGAVAEMAHA